MRSYKENKELEEGKKMQEDGSWIWTWINIDDSEGKERTGVKGSVEAGRSKELRSPWELSEEMQPADLCP